MATMYQTIGLAANDPDELFEQMRAAMTNEEIADGNGLTVTSEFPDGPTTLTLVFCGPADALAEAHRQMASHGPHAPNLALAGSEEEFALLKDLGPDLELDLLDPSRPAVLSHSYNGPEHPRDMAVGYAKCADLLDEARRRGLRTAHEHDDRSLHVTVRGPRDRLEKLAVYADRVLNRTVDVQDEDEDVPA